jgi:iron-sulfur cluster insertion protein
MDSIKTTDIAQEASFIITDNAARRISALISDEADKNAKLRISVTGGGCSGFQYNYDFVSDKNSDDIIFEKNGIFVLIDSTSLEFLNQCSLDYIETLGSAAFEIKNPNATAKCGCGNSFSV